jgi:hypothetical protein
MCQRPAATATRRRTMQLPARRHPSHQRPPVLAAHLLALAVAMRQRQATQLLQGCASVALTSRSRGPGATTGAHSRCVRAGNQLARVLPRARVLLVRCWRLADFALLCSMPPCVPVCACVCACCAPITAGHLPEERGTDQGARRPRVPCVRAARRVQAAQLELVQVRGGSAGRGSRAKPCLAHMRSAPAAAVAHLVRRTLSVCCTDRLCVSASSR